MKSLIDIKNNEVRAEIRVLSEIFKDSFINDNMDFVAIYRFKKCFANVYFHIETCKSALEVKCKVLEYFSRACFKSSIGNKSIDNIFHKYMQNCVKEYFKIPSDAWNDYEFEQIYTYLGNSINRNKTRRFIESCFDFAVLLSDKSNER